MSYFKPNTRAAIKLATAIKGITASLATMAYVNGNEHLLFGIMVVGALANEAINFLSDGTKETETKGGLPDFQFTPPPPPLPEKENPTEK